MSLLTNLIPSSFTAPSWVQPNMSTFLSAPGRSVTLTRDQGLISTAPNSASYAVWLARMPETPAGTQPVLFLATIQA
ncbi:uncharacterized protein BO97DRAFT_409079 [Aspergillus homomorphus CBS 101889]|uniref:Uncharacterized protein n=1 Tax=Aspergillus homomorphus (strain CBS 101889) TaxID=1450537 RepID=A0A395HIM8_ASPHC|nr:hypothetical protein BO97DRAFT_409079 [Aspergillus homomorphus CBS 101889]RAL07369.1 hypothetical protein BO97DRAFT_409079 [Aspergillus homomorphus CBS 101889]